VNTNDSKMQATTSDTRSPTKKLNVNIVVKKADESVLMNYKFFHLTHFKQKVITSKQRCNRSTRRLYLVR